MLYVAKIETFTALSQGYGGELRISEQKYEAEAWEEVSIHPERQGGLDVHEDVQWTDLSETDRAGERKHSLQVRDIDMEGSFGTQKERYDLKRVKVRIKLT